MATKATTLFSLNAAKQYLKIEPSNTTHNDIVQQLADGVSEKIETFTGRKFVTRTVTDEHYNGHGRQRLRLKNYPVQSIVTLHRRWGLLSAWELFAAEEYELEIATGELFTKSLCLPCGERLVKVTYETGFGAQDSTDLPQDLVIAAKDYLEYAWKRRTAEAQVAASMSFGSHSITIIPDLPKEIQNAIKHYRKLRL